MNHLVLLLLLSLVCLPPAPLALGSPVSIPAVTSHTLTSTTTTPTTITTRNAYIACANPICTEIGQDVTRAGGSVVDITIAVSLCLGVVNAYATGIGGGGFMLIHPASSSSSSSSSNSPPKNTSKSSQEPIQIDCRETAPRAATRWMFLHRPEAAHRYGLAVGVPGQLKCYERAHAMYGKLPWEQLFEGAILIARRGFPLPLNMARRIQYHKEHILSNPVFAKVYSRNGTLLKEGEICKRPNYARTLWSISIKGTKAFYSGKIGESLIRLQHATGGIMSVEDLSNYTEIIRQPLSTQFHGLRILTANGHSGGPLIISALNILEAFNLRLLPSDSERTHLTIEALKFAAAYRNELGDPAFVDSFNATLAKMLSRDHARLIRSRITPSSTHQTSYYDHKYSGIEDKGTCHVSVVLEEKEIGVDSEGHRSVKIFQSAISFTSSINAPFGSLLMDPNTGIILNNQMGDFELPDLERPTAWHPNFIEPKKRPLSSMSPVIAQILVRNPNTAVFEEHNHAPFYMIIGGSGGSRIPASVLQVLLGVVETNLPLKTAVTTPRFYHPLVPPALDDKLEVEYEMDEKMVSALLSKGHKINRISKGLPMQSLVEAILYQNGSFVTAIDDRIFSIGIGY